MPIEVGIVKTKESDVNSGAQVSGRRKRTSIMDLLEEEQFDL